MYACFRRLKRPRLHSKDRFRIAGQGSGLGFRAQGRGLRVFTVWAWGLGFRGLLFLALFVRLQRA